MVHRTSDPAIIRQAVFARRRLVEGPAELSGSWLAEEDRLVIAEESGTLLDPEDTPRLEAALHRVGVERLLAVSNDRLLAEEDLVYELGSGAAELNALSSEFGGMNLLLFPAGSLDVAVLCTVDDFRLVAGSSHFILSYVANPVAARNAFLDFAEGHLAEELRPVLWRAATYMDWVSQSAP
jgi:hypothetical protein